MRARYLFLWIMQLQVDKGVIFYTKLFRSSELLLHVMSTH